MIQVTLNGRPFNKSSFEGKIVEALVGQLREKIGRIRHPETGEFPTIAVSGTDLSNLTCHVEGTPELLALVRARFSQDESEATVIEMSERTRNPAAEEFCAPKAFLSYASEDSELAQRIAEALMSKGIDTWWAQWCIAAGDSIRQRIDEGLGTCSHFIVLLTPQSIAKPWVNFEIDAGLVRKLNERTKFIPVRCGLEPRSLTPLLQAFFSPEVDPNLMDVTQLINDIHGLTRKPKLGQAPPARTVEVAAVGEEYSPAAMALAKYFVEKSVSGMKLDLQAKRENLADALGMSDEDLIDAIFELKGLVTDFGHIVFAEETLFAKFDKYWMPWNPADDALIIAIGLVNNKAFPKKTSEIAQFLGWPARRLNPALAYLCMRGLVHDIRTLDSKNFLANSVDKTHATRRFVKSRQ